MTHTHARARTPEALPSKKFTAVQNVLKCVHEKSVSTFTCHYQIFGTEKQKYITYKALFS